MKKLLGTIAIVFGVFAFATFTSASTADVLQPASDVVYDENLIVNATGIFDSVRIGKQDVGGVTFFNGTIVNETTDASSNGNPVTFGDDVRIDGMLWRGAVSGPGDSMPLKLNDDVEVYGSLTVVGNTTLDSDLIVAGNINQDSESYGAVKSGALVTTTGAGCDVRRFFGPYNVTCERTGTGRYRITFDGLNVYERFFQITPYTSGTFTNVAGNVDTGADPDEEVIRVFMKNASDTYFDSQYFMINIY